MSEPSQEGATTASEGRTSLLTIFLVFLRLGFTSFGGPVAHLGYFRDEFVGRRKWIEERAYADLVALCQFLPGPASSQVGIGVGLARGGLLGAFVAWTGFTMPSALALIAFGYGVVAYQDVVNSGVLHGLKVVAVAVVAQAVWGMDQSVSRCKAGYPGCTCSVRRTHRADATRSDRRDCCWRVGWTTLS